MLNAEHISANAAYHCSLFALRAAALTKRSSVASSGRSRAPQIALPLRIGSCGDRDPTVVRREQHVLLEQVRQVQGIFIQHRGVHHDIGKVERDIGLEHRHVNVLADSAHTPADECRGDGLRSRERGHLVGDEAMDEGRGAFDGLAIRPTPPAPG